MERAEEGSWRRLDKRDLRVVPVEGEPVEAFELVLPERVAVLVVSRALQLFPVGGVRPILKKKYRRVTSLKIGRSIQGNAYF